MQPNGIFSPLLRHGGQSRLIHAAARNADMTRIALEARRFTQTRDAAERRARATAVYYLAMGEDLDDALELPPDRRIRLCRRLERRIEQERLRGAARHWSYDLNRHIALKQALDLLAGTSTRKPASETKDGVRRRRRIRRSSERP
jgi:hypothetical protein